MSVFDESYEDRRSRERKERREYENDVLYEVWRSSGDVDRIDFDRVDDDRWDGLDATEAAAAELKRQRSKHQQAETFDEYGGHGFDEQ